MSDISPSFTSTLRPAPDMVNVPADNCIRLVRGYWPAQMKLTSERIGFYVNIGVMHTKLPERLLFITQAFGTATYRVLRSDLEVTTFELVACELDVDYDPRVVVTV